MVKQQKACCNLLELKLVIGLRSFEPGGIPMDDDEAEEKPEEPGPGLTEDVEE